MDGLCLHCPSSGPVVPAFFFERFFGTLLSTLFRIFGCLLCPQLTPKWGQKHQESVSEGTFRRIFVFIMKFDFLKMTFSDFRRSGKPSRIGRADEMCTFAKISFFTPEVHFGVMFDLILEHLATRNRSKSALGGSFESFWFFIKIWTPFLLTFWWFLASQGGPRGPPSPDLLLSHFGPPGALAGSRCLPRGDFCWFLLIFNDFL